MLTLTHASLATTEQLFQYKSEGFELEAFPGYTNDQWGIKAHNRPWIDSAGSFDKGQRILEVGGAYSLLPKYLAEKYDLEAWVGDDFGAASNEHMWSRWGSPQEYAGKYPEVNYVFAPFGRFDERYQDGYFDRIFSVSTLEHIPREYRLDVFRDMNRCTAKGGRQLHSIDVSTNWKKVLASSVSDAIPLFRRLDWAGKSEIRSWIDVIRKSGIAVASGIPSPARLFDRRILVESPDVVYRFYPPVDAPKAYSPNASLLVVIEDL